MERLEKPPVVKELLVKRLAICAVVLLIGAVLVCFSLRNSIRYRNLLNTGVEVTATIYEVKETKDVDDADHYEVYVTYTYLGKSYSKLHMSANHREWLDRVGQTLTITINPENPTEELRDMESPIFFSMFFGLPVFCLGLTLLPFHGCRLSYVEMYGLRSSAIREDLVQNARRGKVWLWCLIYGCAECIYGLYIRDIESTGSGDILIGLMVLVLSVIFGIMRIMTVRNAKDRPYTVRHYEVQDKRIVIMKDVDEDKNDDSRYEILLASDDDSGWDSVSKKTYALMEPGEKLAYIYAPSLALRYRYDAETSSYWLF
jgi:hypothetical protein